MIIQSIDGTAEIGIWATGAVGVVHISNYGPLGAPFNAAELIDAIQEEAK